MEFITRYTTVIYYVTSDSDLASNWIGDHQNTASKCYLVLVVKISYMYNVG